MISALREHWPEYLIEACLLGTFMLSACVSVCIVQHPASPISKRIVSPQTRRAIVGVLMGLTAIALIYSPWGQRSGAHMNPATTLAFFFLGKIRAWDALFYVVAQFAGAAAGVALSTRLLGRAIAHARVNYVATLPGARGVPAAWIAECLIAFGMMTLVLVSSNHSDTASYTGLFAGLLVTMFITFEAPLSGMSMNPARTLGSALFSRNFRHIWIYFSAPPLGMLAAAILYGSLASPPAPFCAKLNHRGHARCIFDCHINEMSGWKRLNTFGIEETPAIKR